MTSPSPSAPPAATGIRGVAPWRFLGIEAALALAAGLLSALLAVLAWRVSPADLGLRWATGGADQILHYSIFTSASQVFPFLPNDELGFPASQNLFFAPLFDPWSAVLVSALALVLPDGVWALNVYNLLAFVGTAFTAFLFFRGLRLHRSTSFVVAVVFAVLPYHFVQLALGHPFLANYWAVPLLGLLVLVVAGGRADPFGEWIEAGAGRRMRLARRLVPILALCWATAFTQSYYFVFAALVVGAVWFVRVIVAAATRSWRSMLWPTVTVGVLLASIGAQLAILSLDLGERYAKYFAGRTPQESEFYGGKIMDLLLPARSSGFAPLASLAQDYADTTGILQTSESASTAVVVSIAYVVIVVVVLARLLAPRLRTRGGEEATPALLSDERVGAMSGAFVVALLFFTTAGLGALLAYYASPEIRAWSRFSIVLSLFALGVAAIALESLVRKRVVRIVVLALVAAVALVDQLGGVSAALPLGPAPDTALREFSAEVDDTLPEDCGIVQLPLKDFPETGAIGAMGDYDESLPYIYSSRDDLRWSYGAVVGTRGADEWNDATTPAVFGDEVQESGACAVLVDLSAYTEDVGGWQPLVDEVSDADAPALDSEDGRYELFLVG
ncbi:hypothetical protein GRS96_15025 [Rathayibacter sp. VKM Ac-2803]|uniref:hypothetical protein n=1 Tax=unclassified Rathayibacter TaxID=2609250 RepID=UPI00135C0F79|nr:MULTISPECIES: hypothetical protein [unclassified Rathayibacter]MWV50584.1 hypothetical protein [Rathayibacter sp. VKM Ac-2803]MWV59585.1 hypothetical protein [Rathayibacter sp. VKM Ac-2754]